MLFNKRMGFTNRNRSVLCSSKCGHFKKKLYVVSELNVHWHMSSGVSRKLWDFLWLLSGLRPTLNWKIQLIPFWLKILKILFFTGQIIFSMFFLKIANEADPLSSGPKLFQELMLSGKKLFPYRTVLQSKVLRTLVPRYPKRCGWSGGIGVKFA